MRPAYFFCALLLLHHASYVLALFSGSSNVISLTDKDFDSKVIKSDGIWLVKFYAPWCGHCKNLKPEYESLAGILKGLVNVAAVDVDQYKALGGRFGIQGFPTIKLFNINKEKPEDYQGERNSGAMLDFCKLAMKNLLAARVSGKAKANGGASGPASSHSPKRPQQQQQKFSGNSKRGSLAVPVTLTASNFESEVLHSKNIWLVEFMAPWCGHCKNLKPEWDSAAQQLAGDVMLGVVDATVESSLANQLMQYGVKGYPTIKVFVPGKKAQDYQGGRTASDIVAHARELLDIHGGPLTQIDQLVSNQMFDDMCIQRSGICVIVFLPHLLDENAAHRTKRLATISAIASAKDLKRLPVKFFWAEGGHHMLLERTLGLGFGYPAVVALSGSKKRFAIQRDAFGEMNTAKFVKDVIGGKQSTDVVETWPALKTETSWDGKDFPSPSAETTFDESTDM